jgi:2-polyprenyl-3-methyl-5-hydroxy-6-metoxy-1,4-benzoquinol methylase
LNKQNINIFDRSGIAALNDLQNEVYQETFSLLEVQQAAFLSKADEFRSEEYKWPDDPLHCWSRIWEYPYIFYHISNYMQNLAEGFRPVVADVGSGVTFFPFSLAKLGCDVVCTDIDPICAKDISQASKIVSCTPGKIDFRLVNNDILPFGDEECDVLYCISVLEHIPNFENTVKEMARILKPGGLCLITCDLDLDPAGETQLNTNQYMRLTAVLREFFDIVEPEKTIHPSDILTSRNSPFPLKRKRKNYIMLGAQMAKHNMLNPILGKESSYVNILRSAHLAVLGLVLQKNQ